MGRKRRGHGEGGVFQRESDGRWVGSITVGRTAEGRQKRRVVYGATKAHAMAKLRELQNQFAAGTLADPSALTVEAWLARWSETAGKAKRETTQRRRKVYIDRHINPYLGALRLNKLQLAHLEGWLADLERDGRSDWTRHQAATVLGTALRRAVRLKLIPFNPAAELVKPRPKETEVEVFTEDQCRLFLAACAGNRLEALFVLALTSGMRQGELLGLHWPEVDFEAGIVKVIQTLKAQKGGGFSLEPPKSKRSRRTIDLPRVALDALADHRRRMLAEGRDVRTGPVFPTSTGNYISQSNLLSKVYRPIIKRANAKATAAAEKARAVPVLLPDIKFHALRHTHASTLLARGRNIREVSERLGHSNPELTLRVYAHLMPGAGKETARVLDAMFGG
jgi:integrase